MPEKVINRIVALGVFCVTIIVYLKTLSTTVVFWDVGEYLASASLLQVPHPPGAPLLLLVGRVLSMIPLSADKAFRMHLISALSGAIVVTFLYLVSVKLFKRIRGIPVSTTDKVVIYGASVVGALSLAFNASFWNNSIEFEAKGTALFFVAFVLWLALRWSERADRPRNEKYLLLIAYMIGLCLGVRPLAVLAIFPVGFIVYLTKFQISRRSFIWFCIVTGLIFVGVYPGIVQVLPSFLNGEFVGMQSDILRFVPLLLVGTALYGVYRSIQTKQKMLHIACLSFLLIVLGYTTYVEVLMRANVDNLPINENRPNNLTRFVSYISREQYGDVPLLKGESWNNETQAYEEKLFPRRYSHDQMHEPSRTRYSSDWDYFWRYQVNHMYIRYLLRNYVGPDGEEQDAGVSAAGTFGIPFFLGLLGLFYHFKKDWRMGLTFLSAFLLMGIVFALYQNQQEPQPRERDYFYAGSYFVFSLWIGIGVIAIIDLLQKIVIGKRLYQAATVGCLVVAAAGVPVNFLRVNWHEHDRSQNYIAWDYSYNLLQSCEKDAILFTNGDNDTFPLWYLQDVEEVRRDVRIVNLSLVNTPWYVYLLKNDAPKGSKKVAISLKNEQIEALSPRLWNPQQIPVPVPKDVIGRFGTKDTSVINQGKFTFTMNGVSMNPETKIVRVQDIMVLDIIMANKWERPIYFAATCSPDSKIGIDNYLWMRGLAYRLKPEKVPAGEGNIGGIEEDVMVQNFLGENITPSQIPQNGFLYRNLNNPSVYYDENVQRMVMNYRAGFLRLAYHEMRMRNDMEKARKVMARMDDLLPIDVIPNEDWTFTANIMGLFNQVGDKERFEKYAKRVENLAKEMIATNRLDPADQFAPFRVLMDIYETRKDYAAAIEILRSAEVHIPAAQGSPEIASRIKMYEERMKGSADTSAKSAHK